MNHTFIAAPWNEKICQKCTGPENMHGDSATCEACSNVGNLELVGKLFLCKTCEEKEKITPEKKEAAEKLSLEQIVNQVNRIVDTEQIKSMNGDSVKSMIDEAINGDVKQYTDFFNAKMPSIIELKNLIDLDDSIIGTENKAYALAVACRKRINYLARVLFQLKAGQLEASAEVKVIQNYVGKVIPEIRMKLRHEFAEMTPNYTPQVIKTSTPKVKAKAKNPEEKLAESYSKMMKIPYDQALKLIRNKMRDDCTCSETPGMCKVHNNITEKEKAK